MRPAKVAASVRLHAHLGALAQKLAALLTQLETQVDNAWARTTSSDGKTSKTSSLYNQGESDATRRSLAERFGEERP